MHPQTDVPDAPEPVPTSPAVPSEPPTEERDLWAALLHRWFVEYNPVYLVSAALVLAGLWLVSREVAVDPRLGGLGVPVVSELYAFALIGGAAFLTRLGQRRPAVMLALLAVLYQGDLTLHVETCVYLGLAGKVASTVWVVLFVVKLVALARALELRLSRSALLVPTLGAIGLALLPQVFREVGPEARARLVEVWVFGLAAAGVWTSRSVESAVGYDVRGRRALRATWAIWSVLGLGHVLYWSVEYGVGLIGLVPVAALIGVRWVARERTLWVLVATVLLAVALVSPASLSMTALMTGVVLALRALRSPLRVATSRSGAESSSPYRHPEAPHEPALVSPPQRVELGRPEPATMQRLVLGAGACLHLSAWTLGWEGGSLPEHSLVLDAMLLLGCALALWSWRRAFAVAPLVATGTHLLVQLGWLTMPRTGLGWGLTSIGLGFALLVGALLVSWRLERARADDIAEDLARARSPLLE